MLGLVDKEDEEEAKETKEEVDEVFKSESARSSIKGSQLSLPLAERHSPSRSSSTPS